MPAEGGAPSRTGIYSRAAHGQHALRVACKQRQRSAEGLDEKRFAESESQLGARRGGGTSNHADDEECGAAVATLEPRGSPPRGEGDAEQEERQADVEAGPGDVPVRPPG
jgi:hypothetical protein